MLGAMTSIKESLMSRTGYLPVAVSDDVERRSLAEKLKTSQSPSKRICNTIIGIVLLGLLATFTYVGWTFSFRAAFSDHLPCGTTADEARSRGCIFELTGSSWVTPECYDAVTEQEFLNYQPWKFYRDYNKTEEVPVSEVRRGNGNGFFVPHEYHKTHCGFLLKKLHRAVKAGRKVDGLITSLGHTTHCVNWMLDPPRESFNMPQFAYTKFPNCGREGGFNLDGSVLKPESVNGIDFVDVHLHLKGDHHKSS